MAFGNACSRCHNVMGVVLAQQVTQVFAYVNNIRLVMGHVQVHLQSNLSMGCPRLSRLTANVFFFFFFFFKDGNQLTFVSSPLPLLN